MLNPAMRSLSYRAAGGAAVDPFADNVLVHLTGAGQNAQTGMANMAGFVPFNVGTPTISTDQSKHGSTSVKFPGTGASYVYVGPAISGLAVGTNDFTVEAWVYATTTGTIRGIYDEGTSATLKQLAISAANRLIWKSTAITSDTDFPANEWVHVAVCRSSGTTRMFQNGVLVGSADESVVNYGVTSSNRPLIGSIGSSSLLTGYIEDLRVTAAARYTAAFTPPAAALPLVSAGTDPHWNNVTLLLMNQNETNGSQTFTDLSNSGHTIQPYNNGTAAWQTTQVVAGSAAVSIPVNNPLHVPTEVGTDLTFGTGDFTVDCMARFTTNSGVQALYDFRDSTFYANALAVSFDSSRIKVFVGFAGASAFIQSTGTFSINTWHHIRVGRESGVLKLFVNKVANGTDTDTSSHVGLSANGLFIGASGAGTATINSGQIDCFRVTKGVFRDPADEASPPLRRYQTG